MSDRTVAGSSVFSEPGDEPYCPEMEPQYWDAPAVGICIGTALAIVLVWLPLGLAIWWWS